MGVKVKEKIKGSGEWWIFINHNGKRKSKKLGNDKKLALEVAKKIDAKLTLGEVNLSKNKRIPSFGEYARTWIDVVVPATCKSSTLRGYKMDLKAHILPVFKNVPVNEINRMMVKKFLLKKINRGLSPSTVTHFKNAIGGILNLAVDDEIIQINPAHKLGKVIKSKGLQLKSDPLTRDELSLLLETFRTHFPQYYPLVLTLARTGMRLGEALALQWSDCDFNSRFITIQRGISWGKIETPKSGKTRRVDMSKQLTETLLNLKRNRKIEPIDGDNDWIFTSSTGSPIDASHFRSRIYNLALQKTGLRKIRIHDLRHTYASFLIQAGESLAYIRDQLGHHSIKVTVDIYGHLAPEGNKDAVDGLDDGIFNAPKRTLSAPY